MALKPADNSGGFRGGRTGCRRHLGDGLTPSLTN